MYKALLTISLLAVVVATSACRSSLSTGPSSSSSSPKFLSFDASTKTVTVLLRADFDSKSGRNFDGYSKGAMAITVPVGWKVTVTCTNDDRSNEFHSCAVVADEFATTPLWAEAATPDPLSGMRPGQKAMFTFTPDKPGNYRFACLVPTHELSGMWDVFNVSASGSPSISFNEA